MVAFATRQNESAKWAILPRADALAGEEKSATVFNWSDDDDSITVSGLSTHGLHGIYDQEPSNVASVDQSNQQYSIYALTDSSGNVSERYAYTAYGQPTFLNASATVQTSSAAGNRYTYTAREWDATLGLHHFRARWMSGLTGRFLSKDPIGYEGSPWNVYEYCGGMAPNSVDPSGLDLWTALPWQFPRRLDDWFPPIRPPVSFDEGLAGLLTVRDKILGMCEKCCSKSCGCKGDANRAENLLIDVWNDKYGHGPLGPNIGPPDDSVGGYLCQPWAIMFYNRLSRYTNWGSSCLKFSIQTARKDFPGGSPSTIPEGQRPVHYWVKISVGDGGPGCDLFIDDGFGSRNTVHDGFPLRDPTEWNDPTYWTGQ